MAKANRSAPVAEIEPELARGIRAAFDGAGFDEPRVLAALGVGSWPTPRERRRSLPLFARRTRDDSPLHVLVRLFVLGLPASEAAAQRAVSPLTLENWQAAGLLRAGADVVEATVTVCPFADLLATADWPDRPGGPAEPVMEIAPSSRALAQLTVRRPVDLALDLGAGCGVQAFLAATHSRRVASVDCNPRAMRLARFNALLNGVANVEFAAGDLFEPVAGQAFDLITCNPPFVIGPAGDPIHTHGGRAGDDLLRTIVQQGAAYLTAGGYCQAIGNWACMQGQDWRERLAGWTAGTGCDVWVLHDHTEEVAEYALQRAHERSQHPDEIARRFDAWLAYYERERIEAIGFGLLTLRKSSRSANWFRCTPLPELRGDCGAAIERGFRRWDFLHERTDDRGLLASRVVPAADLRWEATHQLADHGWSPVRSRLRLNDGLAFGGPADSQILEFVATCQSKRTLAELLANLAAARKLDAQRIAPEFLKVVRSLVEAGFLEPAE